MVAVGLCVAFSGLAGFGLSLALAEGGGLGSLALGTAGLVGVVSRHLRSV